MKQPSSPSHSFNIDTIVWIAPLNVDFCFACLSDTLFFSRARGEVDRHSDNGRGSNRLCTLWLRANTNTHRRLTDHWADLFILSFSFLPSHLFFLSLPFLLPSPGVVQQSTSAMEKANGLSATASRLLGGTCIISCDAPIVCIRSDHSFILWCLRCSSNSANNWPCHWIHYIRWVIPMTTRDLSFAPARLSLFSFFFSSPFHPASLSTFCTWGYSARASNHTGWSQGRVNLIIKHTSGYFTWKNNASSTSEGEK